MNNDNVLYLLDVNVVANAGGNLGGVYSKDAWLSQYPAAPWGVQVINRALELGVRLATSQSVAATLEFILCKQDASDFDALDADSARATAASFVALVRSTGGVNVTNAQSRRFIAAAKKGVAPHLHGNGRGQIDHEDFTVIASALAAIATDRLTQQVVIVSDDAGLKNCSRNLSVAGIAVLTPTEFLTLGANRFAAAA